MNQVVVRGPALGIRLQQQAGRGRSRFVLEAELGAGGGRLRQAPIVLEVERHPDRSPRGRSHRFEQRAEAHAPKTDLVLNVAVALSLAAIGPDRTRVEIWADPTVTRNTHRIEVDSDSARFSMMIENIPSENPKTGRITALVGDLACLRKLRASRIGT